MTVAIVHARSGAIPYTVTLTDDADHQWWGDESAELGGANAGPSPSRLIMSGLGACTVITLQMFAVRKQWPLTGVAVELQFNPKGKPDAGGTDISRHITLQGELSNEQRERLLQVANACPMHKVLTGEIHITTELSVTELSL